jgi:hypothetical protein
LESQVVRRTQERRGDHPDRTDPERSLESQDIPGVDQRDPFEEEFWIPERESGVPKGTGVFVPLKGLKKKRGKLRF